MIDEDPSSEDLDRFGGETAYCPKCGAEVWDEAYECPKCGEYISGNTTHKPPVQAWFDRKWIAVIVILLLIAILLCWKL